MPPSVSKPALEPLPSAPSPGHIAQRIFVHLGSVVFLALTGSASATAAALPSLSSSNAFVMGYLGMICLVPRGILASAWRVSTLTGFAQSFLWLAFGVPWYVCLFWGGIQTWMQRLLRYQGKMGWELVVVPFFLILLHDFFFEVSAAGIVSVPLWTFPLFLFCGRRIMRRCPPEEYPPLQKTAREALRAITQKWVTGHNPPAPPASAALPASAVRIAQAMRTARPVQTMQTVRTMRPAPPQAPPQVPPPAQARVKTLAETIASENSLEAKLAIFHDSAERLRGKKSLLPEEFREHVEGICSATASILECMRTDEHDRTPGEKFLTRYLPATHALVDEHARLAKEGAEYATVAPVLVRSREFLPRLERAFFNEHARLLENDAMKFSAELEVLDTLLKMHER